MYCTRTVCIVPYSGTHPTIRIIPMSPNATLQARSSYGQHQSSYFDGSHICWASLPYPQGMNQARQNLAKARHACLQPLHAKDWLQEKRICPILQRAFFKRIQKLQNTYASISKNTPSNLQQICFGELGAPRKATYDAPFGFAKCVWVARALWLQICARNHRHAKATRGWGCGVWLCASPRTLGETQLRAVRGIASV